MAKRFRLIEDNQTPVFIPFNDNARELLDRLRLNLLDPDHKAAGLERRQLLRRLQRSAVGVRDQVLKPMLSRDISVLLDDRGEESGYYELVNKKCYHAELGFLVESGGMLGIDDLLM